MEGGRRVRTLHSFIHAYGKDPTQTKRNKIKSKPQLKYWNDWWISCGTLSILTVSEDGFWEAAYNENITCATRENPSGLIGLQMDVVPRILRDEPGKTLFASMMERWQ